MYTIAMKKSLISVLMVLGALVLGGCSDSNPAADYGKTVTGAYHQAGATAEDANFAAAQRSIEAYYASQGRYPATLEELSTFSGIPIDAATVTYDAQTGKLELRK